MTNPKQSAIILHVPFTTTLLVRMCWCGSMAEQLICNQQVDGSTPFTSSKYGGFPERPKGADCKSVVTDFGGPNPPSPTNTNAYRKSGGRFVLVGDGGKRSPTQRSRTTKPITTPFIRPLTFAGRYRRAMSCCEEVVTNPPSSLFNIPAPTAKAVGVLCWWGMVARGHRRKGRGQPNPSQRPSFDR